MDSALVVTHFGSTLAGRRQRFEKPVVTLGRRPENDVVFDRVLDALVSGTHAEVRVDARGVAVCDLGSTNGTFVNGRRLAAGRPTPVGADDELRLGGANGPGLKLARDAADSDDRTRPMANPGRPIADAFDLRGARPSEPPKVVGEATHLRKLLDAVKHERRRGLATGVASLAVCVVVGLGLRATGSGSTGSDGSTFRTTSNESETLLSTLNAAQNAVFVVIRKTTRNGVSDLTPTGTAWSCAPGLLATNAHVSALLRARGADEEFIARNGADPPVELRLVAERTHPGYEEFQQLRARFTGGMHDAPFDAIKGACDVALLTVDEGDRRRQPAPLELADEARLRKLSATDAIGFVGFPMEGRGLNVERPSSLTKTGRITGLIDPFLGNAAFEDRLLLAFDAQGGGGASGSPVFDATGRVVGVLFAGDVQGGNGARVLSAGGQTYAQRIDLIREMLAGGPAAAMSQVRRRVAWESQFRSLYESSKKTVSDIALTHAAAAVAKAAQKPEIANGGAANWDEVEARDLRVSDSTASGAKSFRFQVPQRGIYCLVAIPSHEARSVRIVESFDPKWSAFFDFEWHGEGGPAAISRRLFAEGASPNAPVEVRATLYRLRQ